jgi:hypothetical protein
MFLLDAEWVVVSPPDGLLDVLDTVLAQKNEPQASLTA